MKRRGFLFQSAKAAALLGPVFSIRRAEAQVAAPLRVLFWVNAQGYPTPEAFFPAGGETDFVLSPMLQAFAGLRDQMVVVDGVNISEAGPDNGNNHVRSMGKVLTAAALRENANGEEEAFPGGPSLDQALARDLNWASLEMMIDDRDRPSIRGRPFAVAADNFKPGLFEPEDAWNKAFDGFDGQGGQNDAVRQKSLRRKRSILDDLTSDLRRMRRELVGIEQLKLDVHEDALRRAELSVQRDIDNVPARCTVPAAGGRGMYMPDRCAADLDIMAAAFACARVQVGGICWGTSGYHWQYDWVPGMPRIGSIHEEIHHAPERAHPDWINAAAWDYAQLAGFAQRLRDTPDGNGTLLDNTLIVSVSNFGNHHFLERIPVLLLGGAQGRLRGGRVVRLAESVDNSKLLTSIAHLVGHPIAGFGDEPNCGVIPALMV